MRLPFKLPNGFRFNEAKELWYGLICHGFGACLGELFGKFHPLAWIVGALFFGIGTLLFIAFFWSRLSKHLRRPPDALQLEFVSDGRDRPNRSRFYLLIIVFVLIGAVGISAVGVAVLAAKYGNLPYITVEGQLLGAEFSANPNEETTVLVFEDGNVATRFSTVTSAGKFHFNWMKNRKYRFIVYSRGTNTFEMTEFTRDLKREDFWSLSYSFKQEISLDHYLIAESATCLFETGVSELDSAATRKTEQISRNLPKEPYRLVIFGHADETGGRRRNAELSKERAVNAYGELTNAQVSGRGAIIAPFGSDRPRSFEQTAEAYAMNRRAEIFVIVPVEK